MPLFLEQCAELHSYILKAQGPSLKVSYSWGHTWIADNVLIPMSVRNRKDFPNK